jgi:hypothetical protein
MDKDNQKPVEKPKEEKPNIEIKPPTFVVIKKSMDGEIDKPTNDNK